MNFCACSGTRFASKHRTLTNDRNWSLTGTAILEIDATLLTVMPQNECRVWSKHLGKTYVRNRCNPGPQVSPKPTVNFKVQLPANAKVI
jgi:hypothetical protein